MECQECVFDNEADCDFQENNGNGNCKDGQHPIKTTNKTSP